MFYLIAKALHVVFVIPWIGGVAMLSWLLVKMAGQMEKPAADRNAMPVLRKMGGQVLYWITWPAAALSVLSGTSIMHLHFQTVWFWIKLAFVLVLLVYQVHLHTVFVRMKQGKMPYTRHKLKVISELGLLFMVAIIMLAVLKSAIDHFVLYTGIVVLIILFYLGVRTFLRRSRDDNPT